MPIFISRCSVHTDLRTKVTNIVPSLHGRRKRSVLTPHRRYLISMRTVRRWYPRGSSRVRLDACASLSNELEQPGLNPANNCIPIYDKSIRRKSREGA